MLFAPAPAWLARTTPPRTAPSVDMNSAPVRIRPTRHPTQAGTALLNDASLCHELFGYPDVSLRTLVDWQAQWLAAGLPTSGKATKFTVRDGKF